MNCYSGGCPFEAERGSFYCLAHSPAVGKSRPGIEHGELREEKGRVTRHDSEDAEDSPKEVTREQRLKK